jgi:short-subunit dehydrogenase
MTQEVVPHMARHRCGKIVNIGSIVGYVAIPWSAAYSATKSAVHSLTDAMRLELTPLGIRVILVAPGVVQSKFGSKASSGVASIKQDTLYPADIVKVGAAVRRAADMQTRHLC